MAAEFAFDWDYMEDFNTARPLERDYEESPKKQSRPPVKQEQNAQKSKINDSRIMKMFLVMTAIIIAVGIIAGSYSARDTSRIEYEKTVEKLEKQIARNDILTDRLEKLVTEDNVDKLATQLGLIKMSRGSENYMDPNPDNRVVYSKNNTD